MGKCTPITQKAKSSPFPADADLIAGAADLGASKMKGDYGKLLQEGFDGGMAAKEAMQDDLITSDYYPETEAANVVEIPGATEEKDSVNKMRSPFKIDPVTAMKVVGMASSMMGKKKENSGEGSKTTVVVNQPSNGNQKRGGQADNAIDPNE